MSKTNIAFTTLFFAALILLLASACGDNDPYCDTPTVGEVTEVLAEAFCAGYAACWDTDADYQAYCENYLYAQMCFIDGSCDLPLERDVYTAADKCVQAIYDLTSVTCVQLVRQWPAECADVFVEVYGLYKIEGR